MSSPKILLTGATGFIGGTVLAALLDHPVLKDAVITLLLRGKSHANTLEATYGSRVNTVIYEDIDDAATTTTAASKVDMVINAGPGFHLGAPEALIRGLAQRKSETGRDVWMIHTSGTSNVAERFISKIHLYEHPDLELDDANDDVYAYEKKLEEERKYQQRIVELRVVELGLELGVKTVSIQSPIIFGKGRGLFNQSSITIPASVRSALKHGHMVLIEDGRGIWGHVHVADLAELYAIVAVKLLEKADVPTGKKGIIFSANGEHTWKSLAQKAADALVSEGRLNTAVLKSVKLSEGPKYLSFEGFESNEEMVEMGFASNAMTISTVGRTLGWNPKRGEEAWNKGFEDDVKAVLAERK
ncbi:NAD dependent epimerase/dehydratase family protein-like protein [Paraphoma chrysanthemicola]|uniref:NAD dependent epimerase/dehydratase family protein-like protein n=1 Tax=Paraphoma chrysanthemicola TaxID=798071 RepID=A0A8K0RBE7_9PLEO|nr:NAD dependent epimerase/dehydratase family protein-like protein [Paraphoma chrysanthemicola]